MPYVIVATIPDLFDAAREYVLMEEDDLLRWYIHDLTYGVLEELSAPEDPWLKNPRRKSFRGGP